MLYLYAIADRLRDVQHIAGADGEPLRLIAVDAIRIIASDRERPSAVDRTALAAQDRVVRQLHDCTEALLPMRFGSGYANEDDVTRAIRAQATGLRERLDRVRGREQMTVRITAAQREPDTSGALVSSGARSAPGASGALEAAGAGERLGPGAAYLRARAMPDEIRPLIDVLKPLQRATIVERGRATGLVATVYQLIDRGTSAAYCEAAAGVALPHLTVHVSGPAPCYAFA
jgi:hypothetical protein